MSSTSTRFARHLSPVGPARANSPCASWVSRLRNPLPTASARRLTGTEPKAGFKALKTVPGHLLFLPHVGHQIQRSPASRFEFGRGFHARQVVTDAERVALELVNAAKRLALIRPFRSGDRHALGFGGAIEHTRSSI